MLWGILQTSAPLIKPDALGGRFKRVSIGQAINRRSANAVCAGSFVAKAMISSIGSNVQASRTSLIALRDGNDFCVMQSRTA